MKHFESMKIMEKKMEQNSPPILTTTESTSAPTMPTEMERYTFEEKKRCQESNLEILPN